MRAVDPHPVNRRQRWARAQRLWNIDKTRTLNQILDGTFDLRDPISEEEKVKFWTNMFSRDSSAWDGPDPPLVRPPVWDLIDPLTEDEVASLLKKVKTTGPGPDGYLYSDLRPYSLSLFTFIQHHSSYELSPTKIFQRSNHLNSEESQAQWTWRLLSNFNFLYYLKNLFWNLSCSNQFQKPNRPYPTRIRPP